MIDKHPIQGVEAIVLSFSCHRNLKKAKLRGLAGPVHCSWFWSLNTTLIFKRGDSTFKIYFFVGCVELRG